MRLSTSSVICCASFSVMHHYCAWSRLVLRVKIYQGYRKQIARVRCRAFMVDRVNPHVCSPCKMVVVSDTVRAHVGGPASLECERGCNRPIGYLVFHSNYGFISYSFRDKRRFLYSVENRSHSLHLTPPLSFPWIFLTSCSTRRWNEFWRYVRSFRLNTRVWRRDLP